MKEIIKISGLTSHVPGLSPGRAWGRGPGVGAAHVQVWVGFGRGGGDGSGGRRHLVVAHVERVVGVGAGVVRHAAGVGEGPAGRPRPGLVLGRGPRVLDVVVDVREF